MKAKITFGGSFVDGHGALRVVVENPGRKFDGEFGLDLTSPVDTADLIAKLRKLANDVENYTAAFTGLSEADVAIGHQGIGLKNSS